MEDRQSNRQAVRWNDALLEQAQAMCAIAKECSRRGWLPATAGNFSFRDLAVSGANGGRILITSSGLDKGNLRPEDLLEIDADGNLLAGPEKARPSAETSLHTVIYRERPAARAIFHVHTVANTLLSNDSYADRAVTLEGYELLKALSGVETHEHSEVVPILENSQDYGKLSLEMTQALDVYSGAHGILLRRHGLYTWGESVRAAWRNLEALEFLFEVESRRLGRES